VAIGEAAERVSSALGGAIHLERASSLREAVVLARSLAKRGDVVLLAPACSSFDMFADYAERGRAFKAEVQALAEATSGAARG
jgi:UDP-N-acetylmuramoylalanine--D-glutamate ligase